MSFRHKRFHKIVFSLVAIFCIHGAVFSEDDIFAKVNQNIEQVLLEEKLTGASWFIIQPDGKLSTGYTGYSHYPQKTKITASTKFHVGSVVKAILATGVLRLATQDILDIDQPVTSYLPDLSLDNPWAKEAPVTVRHLLDHTAGIEDARLWQILSEQALPNSSLETLFHRTGTLKIRTKPGEVFSYSNMGYSLLGLLIEKITNQPYENYLATNLLSPIGMHNSHFHFVSQTKRNIDTQLAWGHFDRNTATTSPPMYLRPAGQFITTIQDLGKFAAFILNDHKINNHYFIKEQLAKSRGKTSTTLAAKAGLKASYSLGLGRRDRHDTIGYCHSGNTIGFRSMICLYPENQTAFGYIVNTDSETANYGRIEESLINHLSIPAPSPLNEYDIPPSYDEWEGLYTPNPIRFEKFSYLDILFGSVSVTKHHDHFLFNPMQSRPLKLTYVGNSLFSADNRLLDSHVFLKNNEGHFIISTGFQNYMKTSIIYVGAHRFSLLFGVTGVLWLLFYNLFCLITNFKNTIRKPAILPFFGIMTIGLSIPLFFTQSFLALGDLTPASLTLAIGSLLLPTLAIIHLLITIKNRDFTNINLWNGLMSIGVLQWCLVLLIWGLVPLTLWT